MTQIIDIIKRPLLTEKSVTARESRSEYHFEVCINSNKKQIAQAVEKLFSVKVKDVKTFIVRGKTRRISRYYGKRPNWKKAIVSLAAGQKIEIFEAK